MSKKHSAPDNQNSLFGANGVAQSGSSGSAPTPQREASSAPDAQGTNTFDAAGLLTHIPVPPPKNFVVFDVETRRSAAEVGGWNRADRMALTGTAMNRAGWPSAAAGASGFSEMK